MSDRTPTPPERDEQRWQVAQYDITAALARGMLAGRTGHGNGRCTYRQMRERDLAAFARDAIGSFVNRCGPPVPADRQRAIRELIEAVKGIEGLLPVAQALSASEEVRVARFDAALANVEDKS